MKPDSKKKRYNLRNKKGKENHASSTLEMVAITIIMTKKKRN